ncbi:MAG: MarR family transcriptional regulator [Oceanicaulis sp.]|jgi:DNA-binding MarR family transcriptional regulator|uniref:MarR family winged helix-turn-helix transcriptional regulator n=1 Tax=unclassified Oceanicaulis TaxID=2632123 RepID=UPI000C6406F1|nr:MULTISPECIES: MarR family transcriptional regulator [unclassified Oceanicaulis]MBC39276.1 MarR family transcriptional regulator [Oceanicaulis sp.]MBG34485.1 MarR family transcriptional regulator [Oceanicaulis sp.]|tara:strand:+ start:7 stop:435 length:429 start_codon:yes stop_codon:yes gene_type:complete
MSDTSPRLYSAVIKTAERLRQEADSVVIEAAGLTVAQAALLGVVLRDPDATQSDIAVRLELSEPAVTQMVARLQREGLIERTRDASDRRRWRLKVSEEGVEKADRAKSAFESVNARLEKMMGEAVAHDVAARLTALRQDLKN